jgi:DNA-directed RNA polymerase specialized sigma54-like protein
MPMEQRQSLQMRQEQRQILRMEQATLLEMPEEEFQKLIAEMERSPLFQRLYQQEKVIHRSRFPRTDIATSFYQLKAERVADTSPLDIESLIFDKKKLIEQIQGLGIEKFKRYFLFPESGMSEEEIAGECNLAVAEVRKINRLIDELSILSEFYHPSALISGEVYYTRIASVERDRDGFTIGYFSPSLARGRYAIDYEGFEQLKDSLTEAETKQARQLLKRLELVNTRKDTLTRVLQAVVERQALYLESGDSKALLPLSQKELARRLGLAPSSVSRAIRGKSIDTPWGKEVPLQHLFPRPKSFKKELLRQLLESQAGLASDEAIKAKLRERFGIAISRRSVANLRKELKISPRRR